jgi:hypothetical protein
MLLNSMIEVCPNLFVGSEIDCFFYEKPDWAVIHACKSPCHQRIIGYKGSLPQNHPNYLIYEYSSHLFLNIIDPPVPLFKPELFHKSLEFINHHIQTRKVLVHCNNGLSRAPSIALLFLAKRSRKVSNDSYIKAVSDFKKIYSFYQPGRGIATYFSQNWHIFDSKNV